MISGINEILSENSALTTLLGSGKIFPMIVDAGVELPYLSVSLARNGGDEMKGENSGFDYALININIHAEDYDELEDVAEAVRNALDDQAATTDTGHTFTRIYFNNEFDRPDLFTTERPSYCRSVQFNAIVKR